MELIIKQKSCDGTLTREAVHCQEMYFLQYVNHSGETSDRGHFKCSLEKRETQYVEGTPHLHILIRYNMRTFIKNDRKYSNIYSNTK